jgi:hypothetical protein
LGWLGYVKRGAGVRLFNIVIDSRGEKKGGLRRGKKEKEEEKLPELEN